MVSYTLGGAMAWDRKSVRRYDDNGNLHVETSPLTRVQVAPYLGSEIPNWQNLGLDPKRIYRGYRPPEELSKEETIRSLIGIPIQLDHHPDYPDAPAKETRVGSTGDDARWEPPFLVNSLHIMDKKAIDHINDNSMRELSLAYRYTPDFTAGETPAGEPYDFVMRDISANHVALVEEGRAGKTVLVMDNALKESNMDNNKDAAVEAAELDLAEKVKDNAQKIIDMHEKQPDGSVTDKPEATAGEAKDEDPVQALIDEIVAKGVKPEDAEMLRKKIAALCAHAQDEEPEEGSEVPEGKPVPAEDEEEAEEAPAEEEKPPVVNDEEERQKALDEALKACGYDEADEGVKKAFAEGMNYAGREEEQTEDAEPDEEVMEEAKDEEPEVPPETAEDSAKRIARMVEKRINAKYKAIEDCRGSIGSVKATAFDSAGEVYIYALKQEGLRVVNLRPSEARAAYMAFIAGKRKVVAMAQDSVAKQPKAESVIGSMLNRISKGI